MSHPPLIIYMILSTLFLLLGNLALSGQDSVAQILQGEDWSSTHKFHVDISDDQGHHSSIPIAIIKGIQEGPVFTIVAGVHGFEYPPIIATQELIQEIDPITLTGTLIIIPLANPNSFYSRTPFLNLHDHLNLNRIFPGDHEGSITEKIAHYMTDSVMPHSDVFLDIHGGDANEDLLPFVCYYNNESHPVQTQTAKRLSEKSGFTHVVSYPYTLQDDQPAKYAFKQAVQDGKVALSIECGKLGNLQRDAVERIKSGIYNMLFQMKMYQIEQAVTGDFIHLNQQVYIRSEHQGIWHSDYVAGDPINKGDTIGHIKNEFGDELAEIKAQASGIVLYKIGTPPVNVGETIMCIGYEK